MKAKHNITLDGETRTLHGWAKHNNVNPDTYYMRLRSGWPLLRIIVTPVIPNDNLESPRQIAKRAGEKYYEGRQCKNCGITLRYTNCCNCVYCHYR